MFAPFKEAFRIIKDITPSHPNYQSIIDAEDDQERDSRRQIVANGADQGTGECLLSVNNIYVYNGAHL